jgi:hypothetical protein
MFISTSTENPSMGIRFEPDHVANYSAMAEEIVHFSAMCHNILNCATELLKTE